MRTGVSPKRIATGNLFTKGILKGILPLLSHLEVEMRLSMPLLFGTVSNFPTGEFSTDTMFSPKNRVGLNSIYQPLLYSFLRKEVIQPHLPIRLPCYDFTPVIGPTFGSSLLAVESLTSGVTDSHGVTGGVYKTRERIHRDILIRDY